MVQPSFKARAPGSLIIMGEYAVLAGFPAIVTTINRYITITLQPRDDDQLNIYSDLGNWHGSIHHLTIEPPFEYVFTALQKTKSFACGFDLQIQSEFSSKMGLGSSAAVTVALLAVLSLWQKKSIPLQELYQEALAVVRQVQGQGSGADVAASVFGGTVAYQCDPFSISTLPAFPGLVIVYSGEKTTTTLALKTYRKQQQQNPERYNVVLRRLGELSQKAKLAIDQKDWSYLGCLMNEAQETLVEFGVSTPNIDYIVTTFRAQPMIYGAKLSGAGLGDCVIGLVKENQHSPSYIIPQIDLNIQSCQQLDFETHAPGVSCVI